MTTRTSGESPRSREAVEFRLLFAMMFVVFLIGAIVSRLLPWHWQGDGAAERASIFGQAKASANAIVPYAFMG